MKPGPFILSAAVLCLGCDQAQPDGRTREVARQTAFTQLTRNSWMTEVREKSFPDQSIFQFRSNGSYRFDYLTDHGTTPGEGSWNFLQYDDATWWLVFDNGQREQFHFNDDGTLNLMGKTLHPGEPQDQTATLEQLAPVKIPKSVEKVADHLCANPWLRSNDFNLSTQPNSIEFHADWTYRSTYRYGECHGQGIWYATSRPLLPMFPSASIEADGPRSACATRGLGYEHFDVEILDGIGLLINRELYVPRREATNRAVIWALFGHSQQIRVSVRYDMPIRQGVPHRFDVEFRIVDESMSEAILQRFSLTEEFDHGYRLANHELGDVAEISATDLKNSVLKQGDVYKASLTATFRTPGTQFVYFNAMMYDRRQDWDTRHAYEVRVMPHNAATKNEPLYQLARWHEVPTL